MKGTTIGAILAILLVLVGVVFFMRPLTETVEEWFLHETPKTAVETPTSTSTPTTPSPEPSVVRSTVLIGEVVRALDVRITPLEVLEDSRCPMEVECVWAGRVRLRTSLSGPSGESAQEFILGEAITTETRVITLVDVTPAKRVTDTIPLGYRFTFEIKKR